MIDLLTLQNQFVNGAYDDKDSAIVPAIKDGKAPKAQLFDIYRDNLYACLINALTISYPRIGEFVKKPAFKNLCREFIQTYRSYSGNLDDYGEEFADFLAEKGEHFFSYLAQLDWLEQRAYLAKDVEPIDLQALQALDSEKLFDVKFNLHPSCFLLQADYNLLNKTKPSTKLKKPAYFIIYRHGFDIMVEKIHRKEFNFLVSMREGLSLYECYEKYEIDIQTCLQKYLSNGVLSELIYQP